MTAAEKKNIPVPAAHEVPGLIDRGKEIKATMESLKAELAEIEIKLSKFAQTQTHVPLEDANREGKQALLRSPRWILPVRFTSDELIGSFPAGSPKHLELLGILRSGMETQSDTEATTMLERFFDPPSKWERKFDDGVRFRQAAAQWLPAGVAPKFIAACRAVDKHNIPKSKTVVALDDAQAVNGEAVVS